MTHPSELDFFAYCWLLIFLVPAVILTFLGVVIVGGNLLAISLMLGLLIIAVGLLILSMSKWHWWLSRIFITVSVAGCWYSLLGIIWSHFKDFC
jgi:hypothetical protein